MSSDFRTLGVPASLASVLDAQGKTAAFPIQESTLPDSLAGRDVLGRGRTGSGKTLAFSLPLVARLADRPGERRRGRPRALVLAPTRELATQIDATIAPLAAAVGLRSTTVFGGVPQGRQVSALQAGVDILVACPGRLEDLMKQGHANLDAIEVTVLDEADHMADLGFLPGVTRIMTATPRAGQRMLFSATLDNGVGKLVDRFLTNPVRHSVDDEHSPVEAMTHHILAVPDADAKTALVRALASGTGRRILFMRTKHHAKRLAQQLTAAGIPAVDLHGNLSQNARDRNLAAFGSGEVRVLVATDVAARGVHVDDVELVVHVDPPAEHKAYLHRSGRTARAGSAGTVATIVLPVQERDLAAVLRAAAITAPTQRVTAESEVVRALVGEVAAYVAPAPRTASAPQGGGQRGGGQSQGANARRKRAARSGQGGSQAGQGSGQQSGQGRAPAGAAATRSKRSGAPQSGGAKQGASSRGAGQGSGTRTVYSTSSGGGAAAFSAGASGRSRRRGSGRSSY